jgi:predicted DNA-binding antitoxin AbrB/MazE fold protein
MEVSMLVVRGVVKGRTVLLPDSIQLTEGAEVEVRVRDERRKYTPSALSEKAFKEKLIEIGLLKEWRLPRDDKAMTVRIPAEVQGRPLSELIIAERR